MLFFLYRENSSQLLRTPSSFLFQTQNIHFCTGSPFSLRHRDYFLLAETNPPPVLWTSKPPTFSITLYYLLFVFSCVYLILPSTFFLFDFKHNEVSSTKQTQNTPQKMKHPLPSGTILSFSLFAATFLQGVVNDTSCLQFLTSHSLLNLLQSGF